MSPPEIPNRKIVAIPKFSVAVGDQTDILIGLVNACTYSCFNLNVDGWIIYRQVYLALFVNHKRSVT
jgi:hypothetical protein